MVKKSMLCLETCNIVHRFSEQIILSDLNVKVTEGSIYGFLGPNGAGKTTTLRLILGLIKRQQGTISIFGKSFEKNRIAILKKVGSLIESPSLYGHLTAVENLQILQKIYQCPGYRIGEVLELVGLTDTRKKPTSQFSLGMKQRLSLAISILHNPALLILDEPTNGLDPNGIIELREFLKKLNQQYGTTILISSHLLAEIEKLVTHIGIINKGAMMFQGTLDDLIEKQQQSLSVVFETDNIEQTIQILNSHNLTPDVNDGKIRIPPISKERIAKINQQLVDTGLKVFEISSNKNDLEMIFFELTKN